LLCCTNMLLLLYVVATALRRGRLLLPLLLVTVAGLLLMRLCSWCARHYHFASCLCMLAAVRMHRPCCLDDVHLGRDKFFRCLEMR
jgi:uncharacterized membrane protein